MPCWYNVEVNVDLKGCDKDILHTVLQSIGGVYLNVVETYGETFRQADQSEPMEYRFPGGWLRVKDNGEVTTSSQDLADFVKKGVAQNYGREVLKVAAKRFRWNVKTTGENTVEVRR